MDGNELTAHMLREKILPHPPKPPHEQSGRAGRNIPVATLTAIGLLLLVGLSVAFNLTVFLALVCVALSIGLWEAAGALLVKDIHIPLTPMILSVVCVALSVAAFGLSGGLLAFCFGGFFVMLWRLFMLNPQKLRDGIVAVFILGWIVFSGMFAMAMIYLPNPAWSIVALILLPSASDTGGLAAGVACGKHPIAASISPKKSWEGFIGSVILSFAASWLLIHIALGLSWGWVIGFALVTPVLATLGDFSESLLKRELGIKDMGSIFPGHGGMLDRIDAMLFCAPTFYFMLAVALDALHL